MKRLLTLLFLLSPYRAHAQQIIWQDLHPDSWPATHPSTTWSSERYDDVFFLTPELGWAVHAFSVASDTITEFGKIYKTTNGGTTWTVVRDSMGGYLRSIRFSDSLHGWVGTLGLEAAFSSSDTAILYETTDGGTTWAVADSKIEGEKPAGLCGMWACDSDVVYICGKWDGPPYILKTTNRGTSWESIDMNAYATRLIDIYFWSRDSGIVVGGSYPEWNSSAIVLFTSDGGESWSQRYQSPDSDGWCWKISFPSRSVGYVSIESEDETENTTFLKTTDGGLTWVRKVITPNFFDLQGIGFITDSIGWAGGLAVGGVYTTTNGGETWSFGNQSTYANRFRFFGDTLGYCAGGSMYKIRVNSQVNSISAPESSDFDVQNYPNPFDNVTTIRISLGQPEQVSLELVDLLGRTLLSQIDGYYSAGDHEIPILFDNGSLPSGDYFVVVRAGEHVINRHIVHR